MRYFNYLKNIFLFYLISGIVLALAIFSLITIHRYNSYLVNTLNTAKNISINKDMVKNQINKMDAWIKYLKDDLKLGVTNAYSEKLFFQTLDDIKTNMKGASITVTKFEETADEKILPVEIIVPVRDYKTIVDYTDYIESLRMPNYKINRIYVSKGSEGGVAFNIQGVLRLPSLKP